MCYPDASAGALTEHAVTGTSYVPKGDVVGLKSADHVTDLAKVCALCNQAVIRYNKDDDKYERVGEPTEAALKVLVEKIGVSGVKASSDAAVQVSQASAY